MGAPIEPVSAVSVIDSSMEDSFEDIKEDIKWWMLKMDRDPDENKDTLYKIIGELTYNAHLYFNNTCFVD